MANEIISNRDSGPDDAPEVPKTGFEAFKGTPLAIVVGAVLAIAIDFALFFTGIYAGCCGFGFFLVALVLYYIPKLFGTKKLGIYVVIGVVFFLLITALGAFLVSPDCVKNSSIESGDSAGNHWDNVQFNISDGTITVEYNNTEEGKAWKDGDTMNVYVTTVEKICYNNILGTFKDDNKHTAYNQEGNKFFFKDLGMSSGHLYALAFEHAEKDGENTKTVNTSFTNLFKGYASNEDIQKINLTGNAYWVGICTITFFVLVVLMHFMNKYLDKTRAKMEAEGRLYPQGYGRCKECGTVVLPGETCCRKCGAYVDIPDEMRVKKVDSFHCSECGAEVPGNSLCCPRCGAKFDEDDEVVIVKNAEEAERAAKEKTTNPNEQEKKE